MRAETPTNTCSDLGLSFGRSKPNVPIGAGTAAYIFLVLGSVATVAIWPATATTLVVAIAIVLFVSKLTGRRIVDAGGGVVIAATGWLIRADFSGLTFGYLVIGLAAAALSFLPLANWRRQPGRFPVLGIFCAVQGVYIYVGTLVSKPSFDAALFPLSVRQIGMVATLAYMAVLVTVGLLVRRLPVVLPRISQWTSRVAVPGSDAIAFQRATLLVIVGIAANRFVPSGLADHLGAIPYFVGLARIVGISLMTVQWLRSRLGTIQKMITLAALAADIAAGTTGAFALYSAAGCAIAALVAVALFRKQTAIWFVILLLPIAIVFNVAKGEARATEPRSVGHLTALATLFRYAETTAIHPDRTALTTSAERFGYPEELLGYMVVHVPRDDPYWNKQTYTLLPFLLVPRALAPFKPSYGLANEFGRQYGLLNPNDFETSENTPIQVEAWANFGAPGLVGIALVMGALLAAVEGWFDPRRIDGLILGVLAAFAASGGVESGIGAITFIAPIIVLYPPVVQWALATSSRSSGPRVEVTDGLFG
jgi:hypothetical protein